MGGVRKLLIAALTALVTATLLAQAPARAVTTDLSGGDDLGWALNLEEKIADNLWDGQVYEVDHALDAAGERYIRSVNHYGDSALWTGTYLAGQSFRYQVAKEKLAGLRAQLPAGLAGKTKLPKPFAAIGEQIAFWNEQQTQAKARVDDMVRKFNVLVNISKYWNHDFDPDPNQPGFGGGVFAGEPGYLMRACIPADTPEFARWSDAELKPPAGLEPPYTSNRRVFGPFPWENADGSITEYYCENGTSRDAYAGTTFGLLTAFDLVSPDDPAMRTQLRDDIVTLVDFATKYYWSTPRPHGRISLPVPILEDQPECTFCGHDFENFISPLFVQVPLARLNMANAARHVTEEAPGRTDGARWQAIWAEELATQLPLLAASMEFDAVQPNEGYYKYNLHHLTGYNIVRTAPTPELREIFKQAISVMDKTTNSHMNAHFKAITYAMTGEAARLDGAVTHLREWRDYRTNIDAGAPIDNERFCATTIECVPRDQMEVIVDGQDPIVTPGTSTSLRARYALPVANRAPTDFLWQRPPTQLNGFEGNPWHQYPGIDYLLPYWMLRYYGEVERPAVAPFVPWPGPAHA